MLNEILIKKEKKSTQTKARISYLEDGTGVFLLLGNFNFFALAVWGWNQKEILSSCVFECDLAVGFGSSAMGSPAGKSLLCPCRNPLHLLDVGDPGPMALSLFRNSLKEAVVKLIRSLCSSADI